MKFGARQYFHRCLSVHGGGGGGGPMFLPGGSLSKGVSIGKPPRESEKWVVRILLEYFLVPNIYFEGIQKYIINFYTI